MLWFITTYSLFHIWNDQGSVLFTLSKNKHFLFLTALRLLCFFEILLPLITFSATISIVYVKLLNTLPLSSFCLQIHMCALCSFWHTCVTVRNKMTLRTFIVWVLGFPAAVSVGFLDKHHRSTLSFFHSLLMLQKPGARFMMPAYVKIYSKYCFLAITSLLLS